MRPLIEIVKDYAATKGKDTTHDFPRLIRSAIKGLRELSYDVDGVTIETTLDLESDGTVDIPDDYIRHVLVRGITTGGAHVDLILSTSAPRKDDCGDVPFKKDCEFRGTFVENRVANRLEFGTQYSFSKIWIRYVAEPSKVNGQYLVHEYLEEPLLHWIDYDTFRWKSGAGGEKKRRHIEYVNSKNHARKRLKSRRREEMNASTRRSRKRFKG